MCWASMCTSILFQKLSRNKHLAHSKMVHFFLSSISTVKLRSNSKNDLYVIQMARSVNDHVKATGNKVSFYFSRRIRCVLLKLLVFIYSVDIYIYMLVAWSIKWIFSLGFSATLFVRYTIYNYKAKKTLREHTAAAQSKFMYTMIIYLYIVYIHS